MKKLTVICIVILVLLTGCTYMNVPEPERCSLCEDLPCHAPYIINLSTGEKLELSVYEPHPFTAGELAEEQCGDYFSFIRGAGVEGYKLGGESITVRIPMAAECLNQQHFCKTCRERLADHANHGYILADLKDPKNPVVYEIYANISFSFRCYDISIQEQNDTQIFEVTIIGELH